MVDFIYLFDDVVLSKNEEEAAWVCHVENLNDDLKDRIREKLSSICHGVATVEDELPMHSYRSTLREFNKRYEQKSDNIKKGMIGELLTHVLMGKAIEKLVPISLYFNMEESSVTKAFDIVFRDVETGEVWLTEVKSGEKGKKTAGAKNSDLITTAKGDIHSKLCGGETHIWHNAINGARLSIGQKDIQAEIKSILSKCYELAEESVPQSQNHNVILATVVYAGFSEKIDFDVVNDRAGVVDSEEIFKGTMIFSIQKETYSAVATFLNEEAA